LTPLEQSEWFAVRAREAGRPIELRVHRGGRHGWWSMPWDVRRFARWFEGQLEMGSRGGG